MPWIITDEKTLASLDEIEEQGLAKWLGVKPEPASDPDSGKVITISEMKEVGVLP